jgi:hypothetical protein
MHHHCLSLTQLLQRVPWCNTMTLSLQALEPGWFLRSPEAASALTSSVQPLLMCTRRVASGLSTCGGEISRSEGGRPGLRALVSRARPRATAPAATATVVAAATTAPAAKEMQQLQP